MTYIIYFLVALSNFALLYHSHISLFVETFNIIIMSLFLPIMVSLLLIFSFNEFMKHVIVMFYTFLVFDCLIKIDFNRILLSFFQFLSIASSYVLILFFAVFVYENSKKLFTLYLKEGGKYENQTKQS